jgi:hypothetical protein
VKAVRAWLEASNVTAGPLFRPIAKGGRIGTGRLADKASARRVGHRERAAGGAVWDRE